jgi:hypothetical protein
MDSDAVTFLLALAVVIVAPTMFLAWVAFR